MIKGAPRIASKLSIDPINSHASYFEKSTGSNERSVPIEPCLLIGEYSESDLPIYVR